MAKVRRQLLGAAAALALGLAGCGGDEEEPPAGANPNAVRCPLVASGDTYRPAKDSFDTTELIGRPLEEARTAAGERGCEIVVAKEDGEGLPVPADVDPRRIYVYTENGVVTEIEGVGGGI
jgi:hypothetical protein